MRAAPVVTAAAVFLSACADHAVVGPPSPRATAAVGTPPETPVGGVQHEGVDAAFDSIAARAPGFGGMYYEDSVYVVLVANPRDEAAARDAAAEMLAKRVHYYQNATTRLPEPRIVTRPAARPWSALMRVRDLVTTRLDDASLISLDANERENRVVVGVRGASAVAPIRSAVRQLGVGDDEVDVRAVPAVERNQAVTLDDRARPLPGGTRFSLKDCTMMVGAFLNGQPVALTNSHCTASAYAPDGGATQQPYGFGFPTWGREVQDLNTYKCGVWYNRKNCRRADLAAYSYDGIDLYENEIAFVPGVVARPIERLPGVNMTYGSIVTTTPALTVVGIADNPVMGEIVDRVGQTTGWQYGSVYDTCVDIYSGGSPNVLLVCQDKANTFSEFGDSGSPVFRFVDPPDGNSIVLVGINWGSATTDPSGYFSAMRQMRQEMPTLCFAYGC